MLELKETHTGEYLARVICELLGVYAVKPQQIVSITTDNGANVVKMVRDMASQMIVLENMHQNESTNNCDEETDANDKEIANYLDTVPDYSDVEALNLLFDSDSENEEVEETLLDEMVKYVMP